MWVISIVVLAFFSGVAVGQWTAPSAQPAPSTPAPGAVEVFSSQPLLDLSETPAPDDAFSLEVISAVTPKQARQFRVYLYHTHTYEAYEMTAVQTYSQTEKWRTKDDTHNIVGVGAELAKLLEAAGIYVYHDTTPYEPPSLSTAYSRSLDALTVSVAGGDTYDLYIDMHRDSYSANNGPNTVGDEGLARFLFLIGQGTGQTGIDEKPDWQSNQKIALEISNSLNAQMASLSRGVSLKSGRYNQQIAPCCILIEVGNNKNTLEEALASMPYLAHAICEYFDTLQ